MRAGLLTIFGVIAIAAAIDAGHAYANDASATDAASAEEQVATSAPIPEAADPQLESAAEAAPPTPGGDSDEAPEAEIVTAEESSPTASEGDPASPAPARLAEEGESANLQDNLEAISAMDAPLPPTPGVTLGEVGYDEQGRAGRIHIVVSGDTLWDISDAYLGTPWVWPSVWTDNQDIENPHLIVPDDRIWITGHEMRRVSEEEADAMLARQPVEEEEEQPVAAAAPEPELDAPVDLPPRFVRVSASETTGFITTEQLESAASIVDAVPTRIMLSQTDQVYVGLGEGDASVGDQFTVLRTEEKIFDPDTNRLLGYHVNLLGWIEIEEVHSDSSMAKIRLSAAEIEIGDRIVPREPAVLDVEVGPSPQGVDGRISFFPSNRVMMGTIDFVYLNRGELDGLAVGSPLEVYRRGWNAPEATRNTSVAIPDRVIAQLLVVRAQPETAVALVTHTAEELELGDSFRGAAQ